MMRVCGKCAELDAKAAGQQGWCVSHCFLQWFFITVLGGSKARMLSGKLFDYPGQRQFSSHAATSSVTSPGFSVAILRSSPGSVFKSNNSGASPW